MSKNIKEIGKELMGKSLNSFHRKTGLTQLEKNNEMQDGILNGILSQVDDAYIEKTEQSNVIHLDGSGDGVVVLDSIEGNTMVNLFGEFTFTNNFIKYGLNGVHIIVDKTNANTWATSYMKKLIKKPTTQYTYVVYVDDINGDAQLRIHKTHTSSVFDAVNLQKGLNVITFTTMTPDGDFYKDYIGFTPTISIEGVFVKIKYIMLLEGDWTNKEIPPYFEGLQSSFEEKVNDEDKYEIEILMNNKNLINPSTITNGSYTSSTGEENNWLPYLKADFIKIKPNTVYTSNTPYYNGVKINGTDVRYGFYDANKNLLSIKQNYAITTPSNACFLKVSHRTNLVDSEKIDPKLVSNWYLSVGELNTEFITQKQNKIKLLLNEPLRAVGNIKDRLCIIENKLMIKRNCGEIVFDGTNNIWSRQYALDNTTKERYCTSKIENVKLFETVLCNTLPSAKVGNQEITNIYIHNTESRFDIQKLKTDNRWTDVNGLNNWFRNNPTKVVYPLAEPIYEEVLNEYGEPILLEGYENGTLYVDSVIPPTTTVKYTPKMESFNILKEVANNNIMLTNDINDTIIPYMMEVDLMIMEKEMALPNQINIRKMEVLDMTSMQKRTQDMLERLIKGKTLTEQECKTRVTTYLHAGKITDEQAEELMLLISEVYA